MENFGFIVGIVAIFVGLVFGSFGSYSQRVKGALASIVGALVVLLSLFFKYA